MHTILYRSELYVCTTIPICITLCNCTLQKTHIFQCVALVVHASCMSWPQNGCVDKHNISIYSNICNIIIFIFYTLVAI